MTAKKKKLSIKDFFSECDEIHCSEDSVKFTEEMPNGLEKILVYMQCIKKDMLKFKSFKAHIHRKNSLKDDLSR